MFGNLKNKMAFTNSTALIVILLIVALANLFWFFLLPAKGEEHPLLKTLSEIERTIRRTEDSEEGNWSTLRKQIKSQQMNLALSPSQEHFTAEQIIILRKVLDSLAFYAEANWRLYEIGEDADKAKRLYSLSLKTIQEIPAEQLNFKVSLDDQGNNKQVNINNSVSEFQNIVHDKIQTLEEQYGI